MSLQNTISEIKKFQPFAEEDLDDPKIPRETLTGRRGRKMQALEQLKILRRDYRKELLESAAFVIVTGSAADAFSAFVKENASCFSANSNEFYEDLANRIPPALYQGKESMVNLFDIVGRHLYDKAMELDLTSYNELTFRQEYHVSVKSKEDLVSLLKKAVNSQMGAEIVGIQAITSLVTAAIEKNHVKRITPVILTANDEQFALDLEKNLRRLKTRGVYLVVAGKGTKNLRAVPGVLLVKDPSPENIEQTLAKIEQTVTN